MKKYLTILCSATVITSLCLSGCGINEKKTVDKNKVTLENAQKETPQKETTIQKTTTQETVKDLNDVENIADLNLLADHKWLEVEGGNLSGHREPNVIVDIGYGDRDYYAITNEYGQLVAVFAEKIILQDDDSEPVLKSGRYYSDEAKVPGTESPTLDEGHVIADSLGGVSNAYNITPQDSKVNRYGAQSDLESAIRKAGGCTDFSAFITYPDTKTQTPNHYSIEYTIDGQTYYSDFENAS
ncbi:MAG: hypothetical protein ATN31_03545 [Candidatus Epulonipiscioides saccharophilum]|nr:MAG: hypothetical protein ATN31_03545 [Epulopiscium sp. AS2M-Bin001]